MEPTQTQLDPGAVALAKAIRQQESGNNFTARSKDGSFGAYQFIKPTWDSTAKKYGVNASWEDATPDQQNEVAYKQIKDWKDQGYNVGQIASMWNAGAGKPDAYKEGLSGTNSSGVNYNVAKYAESVAKKYQAIKNGGVTPTQDGTKTASGSGDIQEQRQSLIDQGQPVSVNPDKAEPTFGGKLLRGLIRPLVRGVNTAVEGAQLLGGKKIDELAPTENNDYLGDVSGFGMKANQTPGQRVKDVLGGAADIASNFVGGGAVADVAETGLKGLIKQGAKEGAIGGFKAGALQGVGNALQNNKSYGGAALSGLGGGIVGGLTGGALGGVAGGLGSAKTGILGSEPGAIGDKQLDSSVAQTLGSGGKRTVGAVAQATKQNREGFQSLFNRGNGLDVVDQNGQIAKFNPTKATLGETIQAHSQVKSNIYNEYTKLAQETGDKGALVDVKPIIDGLKATAQQTGRRSTAIDKAVNIADDLQRNFPKGKATPAQIQSFVEDLNQETLTAFKSGNFTPKADVAATAAKDLREAADTTIQNATGKQYQALRNEYGAVKSIEQGLVKRFQQENRRVGNGIPGYIDIAGNIDLLSSFLKSNPATFAKGTALKLIAKRLSNARNPESMLRNTFELIQKNQEGTPGLIGHIGSLVKNK